MRFMLPFIILILATSVYAIEKEKIFEQELFEDSNFTADNKIWHARAFDKRHVKVDFPAGSSRIITGEDCDMVDCTDLWVCDTAEGYDVCVNEIVTYEDSDSFDPKKHFNWKTSEYYLYPKIKIEKHKVDIVLTRTFEKTTLTRGENIPVWVQIENRGSKNIDGRYVDVFPKEIKVIDAIDAKKEGNMITWSGSIGIGRIKKFGYTIEGLAATEFTSVANLTTALKNLSTSEKIKVENPTLTLNTSMNKTVLELGERTLMIVNIINQNTKESVPNFLYKVKFPKELPKVYKIGDIEQEGEYYTNRKSLKKSENRTIIFTVEAQETGTFEIMESIEYNLGLEPVKITNMHIFDVKTKEMDVIVKKKEKYSAGENITIPILLKNDNPFQTFKNVNLKVETELKTQNKKATFTDIKPFETIKFETSFFIPNEKGKEYVINFELSYETKYRQTLKKNESVIINIPAEETLQMQSNGSSINNLGYQLNTPNETKLRVDEGKLASLFERLSMPTVSRNFIIVAILALLSFLGLGFYLIKGRQEKTLEEKLRKI